MTEKDNTQAELELRLLDKVLARLYLELVPIEHPQRAKIVRRLDETFNIQRPSATEMHRLVKERNEAGVALGARLRGLIPGELALLAEDFDVTSGRAYIQVENRLDAVLQEEKIVLTAEERQHHLEMLINDILGFGPLEYIVHDNTVTGIMIDRYDQIYVERQGRLEDVPYKFRDEEHLMRIIRRILTPLGKKVDENSPMVDARLPDGSRINVVLPPVAIRGPSLVIRLFMARSPLTFEDLIGFGSLSEPLATFLQACIASRLNIVLSGGAAAGKTAFLNTLLGCIPPDERIITVENVVELQPPERLKRVVQLESQAGNANGEGMVSIRDLVINALRMRPDRIVVGEVRSSEALELLQAINTGHDGMMFTIHARGIRDVVARLETLVYMAMPSLPLLQVRQQIASAIDLIVHQERLRDGSRKILRVSEVTGMQGDVISVQDIFQFQESGLEDGRIQGQFLPTGHIPSFIKKMHAAGATVPMSLFREGAA